ncbi:MAG: TraB/GumN family protein [Chitinophagaceae bacterium]|jgi:uncharacterized protein YbaP (TraB family)|nr:TraB/GumN family protein [Chitinophagaceae bacterium]
MKKVGLGFVMTLVTAAAFTQEEADPIVIENTLLWKISGKKITKPSYLFGTIHMLCKEDAILSDSLNYIIENTDDVYFEVDMDNIFEMLGMMKQMKMRNDTTLADLLSAADYEKVKNYFEKKRLLLPFSMMETYKPFLAASMLMEGSNHCESSVAMEQVIMTEAKKKKKKIKGLETMASQLAIFDQIPYKLQADQLLDYINKELDGLAEESSDELAELMAAWQSQDLKKLEEITLRTDIGIANFTDILLFNRNQKWVEKLDSLLSGRSMLVAVGAGHLPGKKGVIQLLRDAGYTVTPVQNKMLRTKEI